MSVLDLKIARYALRQARAFGSSNPERAECFLLIARLALHQDNPKLTPSPVEPYTVDEDVDPPKEIELSDEETHWGPPTGTRAPKRVPKEMVQLDFVQRDRLGT